MQLLTKDIEAALLDNGRKQDPVRGTEREIDFNPVCKLFNPCGAATWLLTELDPDDPDIAIGLCDLGMGCPEFGSVSLDELRKGPLGIGIERDIHWRARGPLSAYIDAARTAGSIVQLPAGEVRGRGEAATQ